MRPRLICYRYGMAQIPGQLLFKREPGKAQELLPPNVSPVANAGGLAGSRPAEASMPRKVTPLMPPNTRQEW